jgi:hypothetical protein
VEVEKPRIKTSVDVVSVKALFLLHGFCCVLKQQK